jgi:hypothetical protein
MEKGTHPTDEQHSRLQKIADRVWTAKTAPPESWKEHAFSLTEYALTKTIEETGIEPPKSGYGQVLFVDEDGYTLASFPVELLADWRGCSVEDYNEEMRTKFVGIPVRVLVAIGPYAKSWTIDVIKTEQNLLN